MKLPEFSKVQIYIKLKFSIYKKFDLPHINVRSTRNKSKKNNYHYYQLHCFSRIDVNYFESLLSIFDSKRV